MVPQPDREQLQCPRDCAGSNSQSGKNVNYRQLGGRRHDETVHRAHDHLRSRTMDAAKVAQMVEVLNGLTARDALCLLVGCMRTVLDQHCSAKSAFRRVNALRTAYGPFRK